MPAAAMGRLYTGMKTMHALTTKLLPLTAAAFLAFTGVAMAKVIPVHGTFAAEGAATTTPTGDVMGSYSTKTHMLKYTITYAGLSGPVMAAHFHGPAKPGEQAGVLVAIPKPYMSGMTGKVKLTSAEAKDVLTGMTYVNLHTAANPAGEARAQITEGK